MDKKSVTNKYKPRRENNDERIQGSAEKDERAGDREWNTKKSYRHIRKETIEEYVRFIEKYKREYTVKQMCKVLKFARSTYYKSLIKMREDAKLEFVDTKLGDEYKEYINSYK